LHFRLGIWLREKVKVNTLGWVSVKNHKLRRLGFVPQTPLASFLTLASPNVRSGEATRSKIPGGKSGNRKGAVAPQPTIFLNPSVLSYKSIQFSEAIFSFSFFSLRPLRLGGTLREAEASTLKN